MTNITLPPCPMEETEDEIIPACLHEVPHCFECHRPMLVWDTRNDASSWLCPSCDILIWHPTDAPQRILSTID